MATTNNFGVTLLESSQAQKEITINEAFGKFDALLRGAVLDKDLATPPGSPSAGDAYIVAASPTGAWSGKAKFIAYFDGVWRFIVPKEGMQVRVIDEASTYVYASGAWAASGSGGTNIPLSNLAQVSANTVLANPSASTANITTVGLSASQLLGRGSSGDIAPIALGNGLAMAGTTLSNSAGTVIASGSFPSAATLDITNIPQTFAHLGIFFYGPSCDTATREFQIRASIDNGATFSNNALDYRGNKQAGATAAAKVRATLVEHATGTAASVKTGYVMIFGYRAFYCPGFNFFISDGTTMWSGSGQLILPNINALRFMWDASGNFDSGSYSVIGF